MKMKRMKMLLITGATMALLLHQSIQTEPVYGEEIQSESVSRTPLEELLKFSLADNEQLVLEATLDKNQTVTLDFSDNPVEMSESFAVMVPAFIEEDLTVSLNDATGVVSDQTVINTEAVYRSLMSDQGKEIKEKEEVLLDEYVSSEENYSDHHYEVENKLSNVLDLTVPEVSLYSAQTSVERNHKDGVYTIVSGDYFKFIARSFGISQMQLKVWNPHITDINLIRIGEKLAVTRQGYEKMLSTAEKNKLHTKNNPSQFADVHEFIDYFAPLAVKVSSEKGKEALYPSLMLAQAIHETGVARTIGMSQLSRPPYHNLSGIKARGNVPSILMWTWEALPDTYNEVKDKDKINVDVLDYFQTFPSYEAALQRYANLLRVGRGTGEDFYYRGTWRKNTKNVWEVLDNGGLRGYATDPAYFNAIRNIITKYDLVRFDNTNRISGDTRFETAVEISRNGWLTAETVILTNGFEFADALAGAPLSAVLDAPVLLTRTNSITKETLEEIKRLGAAKVIILGGEHAVSNDVAQDLVGLGLITERIGGETRYETAAFIGERIQEVTDTSEAILVSGQDFADAMSVAPFAAKNGTPIYLTRSQSLSEEVKNASSDIPNWTVIGGNSAISKSVGQELQEKVGNFNRIEGANRYETNQEVINQYGEETVATYVATGTDFADALTGSVLAAKNNSQVLLVSDNRRNLTSQIEFSINKGYGHFILLGGKNVLPERISRSLGALRYMD